ncbi:MAG: 2TM domain-containing protein [Lewinella sp.]|nr:2TM domain-containing protein [Lewinella sp.]
MGHHHHKCSHQGYHRIHHEKKTLSPKMRFYKRLRSYLIVNMIMFFLTMSGHAQGWWTASMIWGIFIAVSYVKAFGFPGTNGWFGEDWNDWMEERERRKTEETPEPLYYEGSDRKWRDRDMV